MNICSRTAVLIAMTATLQLPVREVSAQSATAGAGGAGGSGGALALPVLIQKGDVLEIVRPGAPPESRLAHLDVPPGLTQLAVYPLRDGWLATASYEQLGERHLFLLREDGDGRLALLPPPPLRSAAVRQDPVVLSEKGTLAGIAWLEGDDRNHLGVRAAAWREESWQEVQVVAAPGARSQLALSGAALQNGDWLLAWSSFDGNDDEILFALRSQERWSEPKRAHRDNDVPDITPAVIAYRDGARLAWSQFENGHYRLRLGSFRFGRFVEETTLAEPGSVLPSFPLAGEGRQILFRSVRPYGWTLLEIDDATIPRRRAQFPDLVAGDRARPRVSTDVRGVTVDWPERQKQLAKDWEPVL